jgi:hypothetical protein
VLEGTFIERRYQTDKSPHLEQVFGSRENVKELWLKCAKEEELSLFNSTKTKVDYKKFFLGKIVVDQHIDPKAVPRLISYLNGNKGSFVNSADPIEQFQNLSIKLCENMITVSEFLDEACKLGSILGEFQNDLQALVPKKVVGEFIIHESDDPCDLLLIGTEIKGSCQRVNGHSNTNKCLVSYMMNGEGKAIVVKKNNKMVARSFMRLMWDSDNATPVILLERIYSNVLEPSINHAIKKWAIEKARAMGVPLVANEIEDIMAPFYSGKVEHLGGYAPFIYSDAAGGIKEGAFTTPDCKVLSGDQ